MKERPILFNGAMVRAILSGQKTQTRRVVKPQPFQIPLAAGDGGMGWNWNGPKCTLSRWTSVVGFAAEMSQFCPYGQPGDRLWVRETWANNQVMPLEHRPPGDYLYAATNAGKYAVPRWKPSIHMPRAASRITLEITGVRVERLQNINGHDAAAEGVETWALGALSPEGRTADPEDQYRWLWEQINGPGSWDANPWVWVVEFKKC